VKVGSNHLVEQEGLTGAFNQYVWSTPLSPTGSAASDRWFVRSLHEVAGGQLTTNWDELHTTACFSVAWLSNYLTRPVITFLDWPSCAQTDIALCLHTSQISNRECSSTSYWSQRSLWLCMTNLTATCITISLTKQAHWCCETLLCSKDTPFRLSVGLQAILTVVGYGLRRSLQARTRYFYTLPSVSCFHVPSRHITTTVQTTSLNTPRIDQ
jgi:hypothetical protein